MKRIPSILAIGVLLICTSCNKNHYDFDRFEGVEAEGEWNLPIASASRTIGDVINALNQNGAIVNDENGNLHFVYNYFIDDAIKGADFMYFKDQQFADSVVIDNPAPIVLPAPIDTVLRFEKTIALASESIGMMSAEIKSGRLGFSVATDLSGFRQIIVMSPNIMDANGNNLNLVMDTLDKERVIDVAGYRCETPVDNEITLVVEVHLSIQDLSESQYKTSFNLKVNDLKLSRMTGKIGRFSSCHRIDTTFNLFPNSLEGTAMFLDAKVKLRERNSFELPARLRIDTAMISGDGQSYCIFDQMPVVVDVAPSDGYVEVFNENVSGVLEANRQQAYSSAVFALNPDSLNTVFEVADTTSIDTKIGVEIPLKFNVLGATYIDTVDMHLSNFESLDFFKEIVLNMLVCTDIPFNIRVKDYFCHSDSGEVTGTLFNDDLVLKGAFDGTMQESNITIALTQERIRQLLHSDKLIMHYHIDTEDHDVELNAKQRLLMALRAKVFCDGVMYPLNIKEKH